MAGIDKPLVIHTGGEHTASVIWLHGLGADGNDFAPIVPELGLAKNSGVRFIFPHAPKRPVTINGGMIMRAWYDVRAMDLTIGEDSDGIRESAELINEMINRESDEVPCDRIILAGFSQGGAMILHAGLRYPQTLAGLLALSCYLPLPDSLDDEANDAARGVPVLMMHGDFDPVIPISTADRSRRFLQARGYEIDWQRYAMQHAVCPQQIDYIGNWIRDRLSL